MTAKKDRDHDRFMDHVKDLYEKRREFPYRASKRTAKTCQMRDDYRSGKISYEAYDAYLMKGR